MKILFLEFAKPSHWESCQHLLKNLKCAYEKAFPAGLKFHALSLDEENWEQELNEIRVYNPDLIIFGDHRLRAPLWVQKIKKALSGKPLSWGVHVYGCFTGRVGEWITLMKILEQDKIVFISGSEAHEKIVRSFFINSRNVRTFPFPFPLQKSSVDNDLRKIQRAQYGIKESDLVFVYAGRISYQKNVHHLVRLFSHYAKQDPRLKLFVCGRPDDRNPRAFPYAYYSNYTGSLFFQALASTPAVTYLGELSHAELQDFYHCCDYGISLSTYYGEDYGLSLIESLSKGLGCIATNWGGHRDLRDLPQAKLIDVELREGKLAIDLDRLDEVFSQITPPDKDLNLTHFRQARTKDQSHRLREIFKQMVASGGLAKAAFVFQQKDNEAWKGKEFFEVHEKILRPYWM